MSDSEKIIDLEKIINNLLVQNALLISKQGALIQMILGVYKETLDKEQYQNITKKFIDLYDSFCQDSLDGLDGVLLETSDGGFLLRQKLELMANIQQMKLAFLDSVD